jgi:threonine aldolase
MPIDLRSDTVTRPGPEMRRAMAAAEVGDDVYGEDPSAARLEARVAELLGKEAALFVPSGTMANQLALMLHCRRGDAVVVGEHTHCMIYESGAAAALAGVQFNVAGQGGLFDADALSAVTPPPADWTPRTSLVVIENTHNRAGGAVWELGAMRDVCERARQHGLAVHLDGARLWNAALAAGASLAEFAALADTVSVCFSKGLGAPVGSALLGSREQMRAARRLRKMLGGGMRQVGVLCAAALYALEHQRERLAEDHALARELARALSSMPGLRLSLAAVQTNIVNIDVLAGDAPGFARQLAERGVLINATSPTRLRAVTHRDVQRADIAAAIAAFAVLCEH